jgi:hypothetical protein
MSFDLFSPVVIAAVGSIGALLIVFQMLLGYRRIKLAGRMHMKVHRGVAWAIVVITVFHGYLAFSWIARIFG